MTLGMFQLPRFDRRSLIALGLAAAAAALVLMLTTPAAKIDVLVARQAIAAGQPLAGSLVTTRQVSSSIGLVEGSALGELEGWALAASLAPGDPLVASQLMSPDRALRPSVLSITLDESSAALGSVQPGDRVDIYVTWPAVPGERATTELLAPGIAVLDVRPGGDVAGRRSIDLLFGVDESTAPLIAGAYRGGEIDLVKLAP